MKSGNRPESSSRCGLGASGHRQAPPQPLISWSGRIDHRPGMVLLIKVNDPVLTEPTA
jgi:hypothetical protein